MDLDNITLTSKDLASKWGFNDGELLWDENIPLENVDFQILLISVVEDYLIPLCPEHWKYHYITTSHNPIRVWDEYIDEAQESEISVEITPEMISATMDTIIGKTWEEFIREKVEENNV